MRRSQEMNTIQATIKSGKDLNIVLNSSNSAKFDNMVDFIKALEHIDGEINAELTKIIVSALQENNTSNENNKNGADSDGDLDSCNEDDI